MPSGQEENPHLPTLYFIRHGQTHWGAKKRLLGRQDVPLDVLGRRQAIALAECLQWLRPDVENLDFVSSPLERARETMALMRAEIGLEPGAYRQDKRLSEIDYGLWEGVSWEQIRGCDAPAYQQREADPWGFTMPRGDSYATFSGRVGEALAEITRDTVIVAHGGVCRAMLALLGGVDTKIAPKLDIPQDRILILRGGRYAWLHSDTELKVR